MCCKLFVQILWMYGNAIPAATRTLVMSALEQKVFTPIRAAYLGDPTALDLNWWMVRSTTPINGYCNHNTVDLGGITAAALSVLTDKADRAMFVAGNLIHNKIFTTFWPDGWYPEGNAYFQYVSFLLKMHATVNLKMEI